jgi:hypothetical protein
MAQWVALAGFLSATPASAMPTFAIREGTTCAACHVNPSGGGMRNRYGRYVYGPTQLPLGYPRQLGLSAPLDVDIGSTLAFGADARVAFIEQRPRDPAATPMRTLFQMQADLYVAATPFDGLTLYYDRGAYGSFEATALYQFNIKSPATSGCQGSDCEAEDDDHEVDVSSPSFSGYVKVGRFMPAYGLRIPNHNVFTRQEIGFGPRDKDVGAEVGFYLGPFLVQAAVVNGAGSEPMLDDNLSKGYVGRAEFLTRIGALRLMAGGSFYFNESGNKLEVRGTTVDNRAKQLRAGVHLGAALGRFAYLGEADVAKVDPGESNKSTAKESSFRSYQELAVLLVRGVDLTLNYEFREPNMDLKSGRAHRVAAGFEVHPVPYAEIKALYRRSFGSGPAEQAQDGFNEAIGMVHVYF